MNERIEFLKGLKLENPVCIELGVYEGVFSRAIMDYLKPKKLYLVDPWENGSDQNGEQEKYSSGLLTAYSTESEYKIVYRSFKEEIAFGKVLMIQGYSYNVVNKFPDKYFDFVYIDGCHLYGCVRSDLELYRLKLKDGAIMAGHDYGTTFPGVTNAVNEFCEHNKFKIINQSKDGDFALQRNGHKPNE